MKNWLLSVLLVSASAYFNSAQAQDKPKWKEMETFHEIMAKTFHPAENGNLEPIKAMSGEMVEKAVAWQESEAPKGYDKEAVKKPLEDLVNGAKEIDQLVKAKGDNNQIKTKLFDLHSTFHLIMEKCEKD